MNIEELPPINLQEAQIVEEYDFKGPSENYKPKKSKKKDSKAAIFVKKLAVDCPELLMEDIIEENKILHRQLDSMRIQLNNITKEYNDFRIQLLQDRMNNLGISK